MALNLNKLFPFLGLRAKLIIAFTALSSVPLAVVGTIGVYHGASTMTGHVLSDMSRDVTLFNERARSFLNSVLDDLDYLSGSGVVHGLADVGFPAQGATALSRVAAERQLLAMMSPRSNYYRVRFIDSSRRERFQIRHSANGYYLLDDSQLNGKGYGFYTAATEHNPPGETTITPGELRTPEGANIPVISFSRRVLDSKGNFAGILIADVFAATFYATAESGIQLDSNRIIAIVTNDGYYLYHSEKKAQWNQLLADRQSKTLLHDFDQEITQAILSGDEDILEGKKQVVAYAPLFPAQFPGGSSYYIFQAATKGFVQASARRFARIFAQLVVTFLAISVVLGYVATSQIAGPVKKLGDGVDIIADGNFSHRIRIQTNDEIEQLADGFNRMGQALSEREELIVEHQQRLEEKVTSRTLELNEQKEKLQAILDNVPSAFVLTDEHDRVISASEALESITGVPAAKSIGQLGSEVLPTPDRADDDMSSSKPGMATIQTNDNGTRHIEIIHVPLQLDRARKCLLIILTDITERRRLEEHMIRTEKLAATGELAAVTAHEIRNSLTSVKMILQLERESNSSAEDQQALEVAANSIGRAETFVNNLLRLARPDEIELVDSDINEIIGEALEFVRPGLISQSIEVTVDLGHEFPGIAADRQLMKEALVNILLNAGHAAGASGRIRVTSRAVTVPRQIEDFVYLPSEDDSSAINRTIRFEKGANALMIAISDSGPGIDPEVANRLFDPFVTTRRDGTGLGLTTVRRTLSHHNGIVRARNNEDGGAVFELLLPLGENHG